MDPATIGGLIATGQQFASLSITFLRAVKKIRDQAGTVDKDIESLVVESDAVKTVANEITRHYEAYQRQKQAGSGLPEGGEEELDAFWRDLEKQMQVGRDYISQQAKIISGIWGTKPDDKTQKDDKSSKSFTSLQSTDDSGGSQLANYERDTVRKARGVYFKAKDKIDGLKKAYRLISRQDDFAKISTRLHDLQDNMWKVFEMIKETEDKWTKSTNSDIARNVEKLTMLVAKVDTDQQDMMRITQSNKFATKNVHFYLPHGASNIFTGRSILMQALRKAFFEPLPNGRRFQRRFVVHGRGGSGKTELCLQFAQEYRDEFWGIFHVDGSSERSAEHSFEEIAKIGGAEPKFNAGKHFLANCYNPWLLIIDGADSDALPLTDYFPAGDRGCVLVTTRELDFCSEGTAGSKHVRIKYLEEDEAKDVLLLAAEKKLPGVDSVRQAAGHVAQKLDYFPIALVHAGRTMAKFSQGMTEYLQRFERASKNLSNHNKDKGVKNKDEDYLIVYSSNETSYRELASRTDEIATHAIELLHMFAFFHHENIPTAVLTKAAEARLTRRPPAIDRGQLKRLLYSPLKLTQLLRAKYEISLDKTGDVLPSVLKWDSSKGANFTDEEKLKDTFDSIKAALDELEELAFITYNEGQTSFRIHNLVHRWMREGPAMRSRDRAYWCQAALNVLANAIPIPSTQNADIYDLREDDTDSDIFEEYDYGGYRHNNLVEDPDADMRRKLLEHVRTARAIENRLRLEFATNRLTKNIKTPMLQPRLVPSQIANMARFSLTYAECSDWTTAKNLQENALNYLHGLLGRDHELTRRISQALVQTYWELSLADEALKVQEDVVKACKRAKATDDEESLEAMEWLGMIYWMLGRISLATKYHQQALDGWKKFGEDDPRVYKAMGSLGRDHMRFMKFDEANDMFRDALDGLVRHKGDVHEFTIDAKENIAMNILDSWEYDTTRGTLTEANMLMEEVYGRRKKRLGREHSRTLWALANLAKVKSALGEYEEAEELFRSGIVVADRNLGADHVGTLWGRACLAQNCVRQKRYDEAEAAFLDIIDIYKEKAGMRVGQSHPDVIFLHRNLGFLYAEIGRHTEASERFRKALETLENLLSPGVTHPMTNILRKDIALLDPSVEVAALPPGNDGSLSSSSSSRQLLSAAGVKRAFTFGSKKKTNTFPL